jgi:mycothiol system anti-sigma-R factor
MNCKSFRDQIFLFQADELSGDDREACQRHLDTCEACAERLRVEDSMLRVVKAKLPRTPAPPGLETRIRAALREQALPEVRLPWYRTPWFAATAAAVLLVAVLVPSLVVDLPPEGDGSGILVREVVTVVDLDCDQAGHSLADQRGCAHPHHINALKLADGSYWAIGSEEADFRYLLLDRDVRGQQLVVQGRLYPDSHTVRLTAVEKLDARVSPSPAVAVRLWPVLI